MHLVIQRFLMVRNLCFLPLGESSRSGASASQSEHLLSSEEGVSKAKQILDEPASLAPAEDDSWLRLAFSKYDPQIAIEVVGRKGAARESKPTGPLFVLSRAYCGSGCRVMPRGRDQRRLIG